MHMHTKINDPIDGICFYNCFIVILWNSVTTHDVLPNLLIQGLNLVWIVVYGMLMSMFVILETVEHRLVYRQMDG